MMDNKTKQFESLNPVKSEMSREELVHKINVLQVQLYLVMQEKANLRHKVSVLEEENALLMQILREKVEQQVDKLFQPIREQVEEVIQEYSEDAFYFSSSEVVKVEERRRTSKLLKNDEISDSGSECSEMILSEKQSPRLDSPLSNHEKKEEKSNTIKINDYYVGDYRTIPRNEEPDSEENIELMYPDLPLKEGNLIKCATVDKLIEKVTDHLHYDNSYLYAFMLTYRSFTTPHELMEKLKARYNTPPSPEINTDEEFAEWNENVLKKIRSRVTQVLKHWIEKHYYDFDEELLNNLNEFVEIMNKTKGEVFGRSIQNTLKKVQRNAVQKIHIGSCPRPILPGKNKGDDILEWSPIEVARQITLIEHGMFRGIEPKECLNQAWNKDQREKNAPHIFQMISWFNKISAYVGTQIVTEKKLTKRAKIMSFMIRVAYECKELKNYNAIFEIMSGLNNSAIHRLKKTFDALSNRDKQMFDELDRLVSRDGNFKYLRNVILNCCPPCIPYIGIYLTDLTFIDDGNPDMLNGKINFIKRRKLANLIRDLQTLQQTPYELEPVERLQKLLLEIELAILPEEELYKESLLREPRK